MTPSVAAPSRALLDALSPRRTGSVCQCVRLVRNKQKHALQPRHYVSTASSQASEMEVEGQAKPRWAQTPPAMKAPVPTNPRPVGWTPIVCNSDPEKLDNMYIRLLGKDGDKLLSDETKWLAITHKSFDQGRRGYNERLAYLGRRIVELQMSLGILNAADAAARNAGAKRQKHPDQHGRLPFSHPAIDNIDVLGSMTRNHYMHHVRYHELAKAYDIPPVVRWWPRNPDNLSSSGCEAVYSQVIFAIVGALALERGGAVANQVVRERILPKLGVREGMKEVARLAR